MALLLGVTGGTFFLCLAGMVGRRLVTGKKSNHRRHHGNRDRRPPRHRRQQRGSRGDSGGFSSFDWDGDLGDFGGDD